MKKKKKDEKDEKTKGTEKTTTTKSIKKPQQDVTRTTKIAPLRDVVVSCIVEPLRLQINLIDNATLLLFTSSTRVNIMSTIEQLKRYMFMGSGYVFHEITASLWNGMLSAESSDALGQMEKAQWTRSSLRLNTILNKLSLKHEALLLSSSTSAYVSDSNSSNTSTNKNGILSKLRFKYVVDRSESKHVQSGNARWDPYDSDSYSSIYPTFRLCHPEHVVIDRIDLSMYIGVHRLLFLANVVSHALRTSWSTLKLATFNHQRAATLSHTTVGNVQLEKDDDDDDDEDEEEDEEEEENDAADSEMHHLQRSSTRWLHVLRHHAHHVVRSIQEHASTSLHEAWSIFHQRAVSENESEPTKNNGYEDQEDIDNTNNNNNNINLSVRNVIELRNIHTQYVERMAMSCFVLDEELHHTSLDVLKTCLQCAHVVTLTAKANRAVDFQNLASKALDLKEELSMLLKKFTSLMERHRSSEQFIVLMLSLRSLTSTR